MTIDNRIAIAALIISFTSPFVKALAERWIAKPVAIPEENKPTNQNQPKSRFSRLVMSKGFELFLALLTLASVVPLAGHLSAVLMFLSWRLECLRLRFSS